MFYWFMQKQIIKTFLLSICLLIPAAQADPLKGGVQHDTSGPLFGNVVDQIQNGYLPMGVKFDETVEPVSKDLKLHKLFSSVEMPAEDREDTWYEIPKWRAGEFHREKQIDHTQTGDRVSVSRADHVYGMQVDKKGNIWHHMSWPKITRVALDGYSQYKIINRYEPVIMNEKEYCVKISSTNIDVDDKNNKIIRTAKQEEIDTYYPLGSGRSKGECLIQGFSQHGRPNTQIEACTVEEELTKPFSVVNTFRGKNLRESFKAYLQTHNLNDLIPEDLK